MRWLLPTFALLWGLATPRDAQAQLKDVAVALPQPHARARVAAVDSAAPLVVFLNFDGQTTTLGPLEDASAGQSTLCAASIPALDTAPIGGPRADVIESIRTVVANLYAGYRIDFVVERPTQGPYSMVVVGGSGSLCNRAAGFGGLSPLDCGNAQASGEISFVFAEGIGDAEFIGLIVAHEIGHMLGLVHTLEPCAVMSNGLCTPLSGSRFWDTTIPTAPDPSQNCGLAEQWPTEVLGRTLGRPDAGGCQIPSSNDPGLVIFALAALSFARRRRRMRSR